MDQAVRSLLLAADRLGQWEHPTDDEVDLWPAIKWLASEIEKITGYNLELDRSVQDASFFTDISLWDYQYYGVSPTSRTIYAIFTFRFSNFGRLFTLVGSEWEERFEELKLSQCLELIRSMGFVYVAAVDLDAPYDGLNALKNPIDGSKLTWWIRFFDYL